MFPCPSIAGGLGFCPLTLHQHKPYKLSPLTQYLCPPITPPSTHIKETFKNTNIRTFFSKAFNDSYHPQNNGQCLCVAYNALVRPDLIHPHYLISPFPFNMMEPLPGYWNSRGFCTIVGGQQTPVKPEKQ